MNETRSHGESAEWKISRESRRGPAPTASAASWRSGRTSGSRTIQLPVAQARLTCSTPTGVMFQGPMELAAHAVKETGGDLGDELGRLRAMSAEKVGSMVERLQNPAVEPSLQSSGYAGVTTLHGFGLVDCWSGGSESISLGPLLIGQADAIDADDYRTSSVTLSDGLPAVWFPKASRARVEAIVDGAQAGGSVSAQHRPRPGAEAQQFAVFVLNAGTDELASELRRLAEHEEPTTHASLALARGSTFVLVIARSWVQGTDGLETSDALGRFAGGLS